MKFKVGTLEFEIKDADITKAIAENTASLDLAPDVIVRTPSDEVKFVENMKKAARIEGIEISVKKQREALGLSFEGKTIENLISAVTDKVKSESGVGESEKITKLEAKVKEKDSALTAALSEVSKATDAVKTLKSSYKVNKALEAYIPKDTILPIDDVKTILSSKLRFIESETGVIEAFDMDGNQITNPQTRDALPVKEVIEDFFRTNTHYMKEIDGGGGGKDSAKGGTGKMTIEKFNEDMKTKGYQINTSEYDAELNKAIASKTLEIE